MDSYTPLNGILLYESGMEPRSLYIMGESEWFLQLILTCLIEMLNISPIVNLLYVKYITSANQQNTTKKIIKIK